jgi:hypothetical protein
MLGMRLEDYVELLDWTGKCVVEGKRGVLPECARQALERMELDVENWVETVERDGGRESGEFAAQGAGTLSTVGIRPRERPLGIPAEGEGRESFGERGRNAPLKQRDKTSVFCLANK